MSAARTAVLHLGALMCFCGVMPFILHYVWGRWNAMQLGQWINFMPTMPVGSLCVVEALPIHEHKVLWAFVEASLFLWIGGVCTYGALQIACGPDRVDAYGTPQMYMFAGQAAVNGIMAVTILVMAMRQSTTDYEMYALNRFAGRVITGTSGLIVMLGFLAPIMMLDPDLAWNHPYAPGTCATAFTWICVGLFEARVARLLGGDASNEDQLGLPDVLDEVDARRQIARAAK